MRGRRMSDTTTPSSSGSIVASAASAVVFGLYRMMKRPAPPAEAQGPFRSLPRTTPVASPLDPRGEDEPQLSLDLESAFPNGRHAAE